MDYIVLSFCMACGINLYHCSIVKLLSCVRIVDLKGEFKNVGLDFTKWNKKCYFCILFLTEINQEMIEDIKKACQVHNEGGGSLHPPMFVWGIGCDATNEEAVRRV